MRERDVELLRALGDLGVAAAGRRHPGQVAFHVGHEDGHADRGEPLRERLQRDRFAGAGGAADQAVSIRKTREHPKLDAAGFRNDEGIGHSTTIPHPP